MLGFALWSLCLCGAEPQPATKPFEILVVDRQTQRGVPLVELETTHGVTYVTDSRGVVAFDEPGLLGLPVWFGVRSHGYEFPADGFGLRGKTLETSPGGAARLEIDRRNIAERLCRLTGAGINRDSVLTGRVPAEPAALLRAQITGCDSVQSAVYQGRLYWFWGDTAWTRYPLGNFHMTGATSALPGDGFDPSHGLDYQYFVNERGFARGVARMEGDGPTWCDGVTVLRDADGRERMFAAYVKVRPPLTIYRRGICEWREDRQEFAHVADMPLDAPVYPFGHPCRLQLDGVEYVAFGDPFLQVRVRPQPESYLNLAEYEAFTCLAPGSRVADRRVERDAQGNVVYGWKRDTPALTPGEEADWIAAGVLPRAAARWQLRDASTQQAVRAHRGSTRWNAYRRKWIAIVTEERGTSYLGEVWYAEADQPTGPWGNAVKVVTHDKYSFYNPLHHDAFDADRGRIIYFEGTYTHTFSGNPHRTPRYDYNQLLYRLDLSDPRLAPAAGR